MNLEEVKQALAKFDALEDDDNHPKTIFVASLRKWPAIAAARAYVDLMEGATLTPWCEVHSSPYRFEGGCDRGRILNLTVDCQLSRVRLVPVSEEEK